MRLRIGQTVNATDGRFGTLGDIVVDPLFQTVTHVVAEPDKQFHQARLVPIWLIREDDSALKVSLDLAHLHRLERVSRADYRRLGRTAHLGDEWDIGTVDVLYAPDLGYEIDLQWQDDRVGATYERIPRADIEIRRTSAVVTRNGRTVGHVEGLTSDDSDHITAVVVRAGLPGFRHDVMLPLAAIAEVRNDQIKLTLDRHEFNLLPSTDVLGDSTETLPQHIADLEQRAGVLTQKFATRARTFVAKSAKRLPR